MTTRCKFRCQSVTKRVGWSGVPFHYAAEFTVVTGGDSSENTAFFAATPNGRLEVSTVKQDVFEVGASYYLDITKTED